VRHSPRNAVSVEGLFYSFGKSRSLITIREKSVKIAGTICFFIMNACHTIYLYFLPCHQAHFRPTCSPPDQFADDKGISDVVINL
jgi:hypothetical protein